MGTLHSDDAPQNPPETPAVSPTISPDRLRWEFRPEWAAWWLMLPDDGLTARRGFGPFNATEAVWAAEVHGVPFPYAREAVKGEME